MDEKERKLTDKIVKWETHLWFLENEKALFLWEVKLKA